MSERLSLTGPRFSATSVPRALVSAVIVGALLFAQTLCYAQSKDPSYAVAKTVASDECARKTGTAWIVRLQGDQVYLLTASHVVEGCKTISLEFGGTRGQQFSARVIKTEGGDPKGLALLAITGGPASHRRIELTLDAAELRPGDPINTIGFPAGGGEWSIFSGTFAGFDGSTLIVQIPVDEGSSGGPVLRNGKVVGVVVLGKTTTGLAVSARAALDFVRGTLGLTEPKGPKDGAPEDASTQSGNLADRVVQLQAKSVSNGNSSWIRPVSIRGQFALKDRGVAREYKFFVRIPDKVLLIEDHYGISKEYFAKDGTDYWTLYDVRVGGEQAETLTDERQRNWLDWLSGAVAAFWPLEKGDITAVNNVDRVREEQDGSSKLFILELKEAYGTRQSVYVNAATGLVDRVRYRSASEEWEMRYENYKRIDGTPFPFVWKAGGATYFFTEVSFLQNPDAWFARPRKK